MAFTVADHPDTGEPYLKADWVSGDMAEPRPVGIANDVVFVLANGEHVRQTVRAGIFPYGELQREELLKDSQRLEDASVARLRALDAQTGKTLFDSGPEAFNTWSHFTGIAVADGQVYAVDFSDTLYCFGLKEAERVPRLKPIPVLGFRTRISGAAMQAGTALGQASQIPRRAVWPGESVRRAMIRRCQPIAPSGRI